MSSIVSALALVGSFFALCACGVGVLYVYIAFEDDSADAGRVGRVAGVLLACSIVAFTAAAVVKGLIQ